MGFLFSNRKKIIWLIAIAITVIVSLFFVPQIISEYKQKKCAASVSLMESNNLDDFFQQIILDKDKVNRLDLAGREAFLVGALLSKELECFVSADDQKLRRVISLMDELLKNKAGGGDSLSPNLWKSIKNMSDYLENSRSGEFGGFFNILIYYLPSNLDNLCPKKIRDSCLMQMKKYPDTLAENEEWCSNVCSLLSYYGGNKDKLIKEVVNFKDWSKREEDLQAEYFWREIMVYRFLGKEETLNFCNHLPSDKIKSRCFGYVDFADIKIAVQKLDCHVAERELARRLCD